VHLVGELDLNCRGLVEAVLQRTARDAPGDDVPAKAMVVDLAELEFMDVAGFRALLRGTEQWRGSGGTLVLTGAHGTTRRVIEIVGGRSCADVILR
jgi:anti-anti-sigma factor